MKCIMDTNVPVKASYPLSECREEELELVGACIEFIHDLINNPKSKLVLDMDWEILGEYKDKVKDTDMGKQFFRWLYTYINQMDVINDMVKLERQDNEYVVFPKDKKLEKFDRSDRKFIALALTHNEKPPIIQAADGKWLEFTEKFKEYGIHIKFLDMNYADSKYCKKIRDKRR